jgi:hypothetical protein
MWKQLRAFALTFQNTKNFKIRIINKNRSKKWAD